MVKGTKGEDVSKIQKPIHKGQRGQVVEVTAGISPKMMLKAREALPMAEILNDSIHVRHLLTEALTAIPLECKREAQDVQNVTKMLCKEIAVEYQPFVCINGDTLKQMFARSSRLIIKSRSKWTATQGQRAEMHFWYSPRMKMAYGLSQRPTAIFNICKEVNTAIEALDRWTQKVIYSEDEALISIVDTIKANIDTIANYFQFRSTNASAQSFNAKVKIFSAQLKAVRDIPFFIYSLTKLFA